MVQCVSLVNKSNVTRKQINGVEHIIVSSHTLPDDIVMNDIFYSSNEIEKSFSSLERTLAPIEHPTNSSGEFISASDPDAIHNFHVGAFNVNVTRENGRVHIEKHINVQEALKTDKGKRLLDRIDELENNEKPRAVHTSVGVFLLVDELDEPKTNSLGQKYSLAAKEMVFDHDAILLDSIGAATPEQGVGMAVNAEGDKIEVEQIIIEESEINVEEIADGPSFRMIENQLNRVIKNIVAGEWIYIVDVFISSMRAIFETPQGFFSVPFTIKDADVNISGIPIRVDEKVEYQPKVNHTKGVELMKKMILNALAKAGIATDGLTDEQLFKEYSELMANVEEKDPEEKDPETKETDLAEVITNALKPISDKVDALSTQVNKRNEDEKTKLIGTITVSKKYPGLDEEAAKKLPIETLKSMAANCGSAHGLPITNNLDDGDTTFDVPSDIPE